MKLAKKIVMSDADIEAMIAELKAKLKGKKCATSSSVTLTATPKSDDRTATLYITADAWLKMIALVNAFSTEVEWHGLAKRISECEYEIYDVLVFPHAVTGTTVTSEYPEYTAWLESLDDKTFADLKMHGHSHVNMAVSPSGVDNQYRDDVVGQLPTNAGDDTFYIFMILNKKLDISAEIYDVSQNAKYDTTDIDIGIECGGGMYLDGFIAGAKKLVTEEKLPALGTYGKKGAAAGKKKSALDEKIDSYTDPYEAYGYYGRGYYD